MWCGIGPEAGRAVSDQESYEYAKEHLDDMPEEDKKLFVSFSSPGTGLRRKEKVEWNR